MLLNTLNNLPIEFTQGDDVTLTFICTDDSGNPQTLTGASVSTQVQGPNGVGVVTFPSGQHTILNQTTNQGQVTLALGNAGADSTSCGEGTNKAIFLTAVIAGVSTAYRGINLLTVYGPSPVQ